MEDRGDGAKHREDGGLRLSGKFGVPRVNPFTIRESPKSDPEIYEQPLIYTCIPSFDYCRAVTIVPRQYTENRLSVLSLLSLSPRCLHWLAFVGLGHY